MKRSRLVSLHRGKAKEFIAHLEKDMMEAQVGIKEMKTGIKRDKETVRYLKGLL